MSKLMNHVVDDALAQLPLGRYLMTAAFDGYRGGMIVHSVQRCSDDPLLICIAAKKGHKIDPLIRDSRAFAIGIACEDDKLIARRFAFTDSAPIENRDADEDDPFEAMECLTLQTGAPILPRCSTWFDCEVMRRVDLESDTELFVGLVQTIWHQGERVDIEQTPSHELSD